VAKKPRAITRFRKPLAGSYFRSGRFFKPSKPDPCATNPQEPSYPDPISFPEDPTKPGVGINDPKPPGEPDFLECGETGESYTEIVLLGGVVLRVGPRTLAALQAAADSNGISLEAAAAAYYRLRRLQIDNVPLTTVLDIAVQLGSDYGAAQAGAIQAVLDLMTYLHMELV